MVPYAMKLGTDTLDNSKLFSPVCLFGTCNLIPPCVNAVVTRKNIQIFLALCQQAELLFQQQIVGSFLQLFVLLSLLITIQTADWRKFPWVVINLVYISYSLFLSFRISKCPLSSAIHGKPFISRIVPPRILRTNRWKVSSTFSPMECLGRSVLTTFKLTLD